MAKFIPEFYRTESGHLVRRVKPGEYIYRGYNIRKDFTFWGGEIVPPQQDNAWEVAAILNPGEMTGRTWEKDAFCFSDMRSATAEIDRMTTLAAFKDACQEVNELLSIGCDVYEAIYEAASEFDVNKDLLFAKFGLLDDVHDDSRGIHGQDD